MMDASTTFIHQAAFQMIFEELRDMKDQTPDHARLRNYLNVLEDFLIDCVPKGGLNIYHEMMQDYAQNLRFVSPELANVIMRLINH